MRECLLAFFAILAIAFAEIAHASSASDRAFSATGTNCRDVTWSAESLSSYPHVASACRGVMQRDGKYFVKFEGKVQRILDQGKQLRVDFKGGGVITLTPPEGLAVDMDGKQTAVRNLRAGDSLSIYVSQDQLASALFAPAPEEGVAVEPMAPAHVASADKVVPMAEPPTVATAPAEPTVAATTPTVAAPVAPSASEAANRFPVGVILGVLVLVVGAMWLAFGRKKRDSSGI